MVCFSCEFWWFVVFKELIIKYVVIKLFIIYFIIPLMLMGSILQGWRNRSHEDQAPGPASPGPSLCAPCQPPQVFSQGRESCGTMTKRHTDITGSAFTGHPTPPACALSSLLVHSLTKQGPSPPTSPSRCLSRAGCPPGF